MNLFEVLFGRHIQGPRSGEIEAYGSISPSDIKRTIQLKIGLTKEQVNEIYHLIFNPREGIISTAVISGLDVKLTGLGKFERRERTSGEIRLANGEIIEIAPRNYPAFKTSEVWKKVIRDG